MNLAQLSDRFEIRDLIVRYANALDARSFQWLDEIFTPDAYVDYRATGGIDGPYAKIREWLPGATGAFPHMCHLVGNIAVTLDEDTARAHAVPESGRSAPARRRQPGDVPRHVVRGRAHPHFLGLAHEAAGAGRLHPAQRALAPHPDARRHVALIPTKPKDCPC